jgi:hypothetical protein
LTLKFVNRSTNGHALQPHETVVVAFHEEIPSVTHAKSLMAGPQLVPESTPVLKWGYMKKIAVHLSLEELKTILMMADNQLFRIKFIDSKLPGHIKHPEELQAAQSVVRIFQAAFKEAKGFPPAKDQQPGFVQGASTT